MGLFFHGHAPGKNGETAPQGGTPVEENPAKRFSDSIDTLPRAEKIQKRIKKELTPNRFTVRPGVSSDDSCYLTSFFYLSFSDSIVLSFFSSDVDDIQLIKCFLGYSRIDLLSFGCFSKNLPCLFIHTLRPICSFLFPALRLPHKVRLSEIGCQWIQ